MNDQQNTAYPTARKRAYALLEGAEPTRLAILVRTFIATVIILNVIAVLLESSEAVLASLDGTLMAFEIVSVILFTIEYGLRIWAAAEDPQFHGAGPWRGRWHYLRSGMGIIDLVAVAPFYLGFVISLDLRHVRAFRLLRLLKLNRYFRSLDIFSYVFRSQIPNLIAATLVILVLMLLSSSLMYAVEGGAGIGPVSDLSQTNAEQNPSQFDSVAQAMWWSVVTLTTVGYGDVIPATPIGRLLGGFIMLLGIGLAALPAAILAGKFADELARRRDIVTRRAVELLQDGTLDQEEQKSLERRGHREGFSDEEIEQIRKSAMASVKGLGTCPNCGHTLPHSNE